MIPYIHTDAAGRPLYPEEPHGAAGFFLRTLELCIRSWIAVEFGCWLLGLFMDRKKDMLFW